MGYVYGEIEPVEECGCCGGDARAEFCDVGVGYARISEYRCTECGAEPGASGNWIVAPSPSASGERVTGFLILPSGAVFETTWDKDHKYLYKTMRTTFSSLRSRGAVRITNLEGYAIDIPAFMPDKAKRALSRTLKLTDGSWGLPYVMVAGEDRGREMSHLELMALVSRLPSESPVRAAGVPVP